MEKIAIAVFQQRNTPLGFTKQHVRIVSKTLYSKYFTEPTLIHIKHTFLSV